jgi:hypothetical protein
MRSGLTWASRQLLLSLERWFLPRPRRPGQPDHDDTGPSHRAGVSDHRRFGSRDHDRQ